MIGTALLIECCSVVPFESGVCGVAGGLLYDLDRKQL